MLVTTKNPSISFLGKSPVIGDDEIRETFCDRTLEQAEAAANAPGVSKFILNPDAHLGYGVPVGSVLVSDSHVYPAPVGVDIKCSMSLLQTDVPAEVFETVRGRVFAEVRKRVVTGAGHARPEIETDPQYLYSMGRAALQHGGRFVDAPESWLERCEDVSHGNPDPIIDRIYTFMEEVPNLYDKMLQLGTLGGGNHFLEANITEVADCPDSFGLRDGCLSFLTHCGSRGIGNILAAQQMAKLQQHFETWRIPFPGGDRSMVYAPVDSFEAESYLLDMAIGANFATANHLFINKLIADAVRAVLPGSECDLVYLVSHNIIREEVVGGRPQLVHRKGATRAFPAGHPELAGTPFADSGHPILLPGNSIDGSVVMVAAENASLTAYSVNHGAGRCLGRRQAKQTLNQESVDRGLRDADVLHSGGEHYPIDEAPDAYKDFGAVIRSVEGAGLARTTARLRPRFVLKDS